MRIISNFKDAYDLQHALFDEGKAWHRKTEELIVKFNPEDRALVRYVGTYSSTRLKIFPMFIAGNVYYIYELKDKYGNITKTTNLDKILPDLVKAGFSKLYGFNGTNLERSIKSLRSEVEELKVDALKVFTELRVPLAVINELSYVVPDSKSTQAVDCYNIIVNPRLINEYPWQEMDSNLYRLHQELEQYIWGVLGTGEPDLLQTSDKDRLEAHGFSSVSSFRNMARDK